VTDTVNRDSIGRVAFVYRVPEEQVTFDARFGTDLKSRATSYWVENEAEQLLVDIQEIEAGLRREGTDFVDEVHTVGDFCALVEKFRTSNQEGYRQLVARWQKEATMSERPLWRRILNRATGL
jgi:hypothetical protein